MTFSVFVKMFYWIFPIYAPIRIYLSLNEDEVTELRMMKYWMNLWGLANASVQSTIALQLYHRKDHNHSFWQQLLVTLK